MGTYYIPISPPNETVKLAQNYDREWGISPWVFDILQSDAIPPADNELLQRAYEAIRLCDAYAASDEENSFAKVRADILDLQSKMQSAFARDAVTSSLRFLDERIKQREVVKAQIRRDNACHPYLVPSFERAKFLGILDVVYAAGLAADVDEGFKVMSNDPVRRLELVADLTDDLDLRRGLIYWDLDNELDEKDAHNDWRLAFPQKVFDQVLTQYRATVWPLLDDLGAWADLADDAAALGLATESLAALAYLAQLKRTVTATWIVDLVDNGTLNDLKERGTLRASNPVTPRLTRRELENINIFYAGVASKYTPDELKRRLEANQDIVNEVVAKFSRGEIDPSNPTQYVAPAIVARGEAETAAVSLQMEQAKAARDLTQKNAEKAALLRRIDEKARKVAQLRGQRDPGATPVAVGEDGSVLGFYYPEYGGYSLDGLSIKKAARSVTRIFTHPSDAFANMLDEVKKAGRRVNRVALMAADLQLRIQHELAHIFLPSWLREVGKDVDRVVSGEFRRIRQRVNKFLRSAFNFIKENFILIVKIYILVAGLILGAFTGGTATVAAFLVIAALGGALEIGIALRERQLAGRAVDQLRADTAAALNRINQEMVPLAQQDAALDQEIAYLQGQAGIPVTVQAGVIPPQGAVVTDHGGVVDAQGNMVAPNGSYSGLPSGSVVLADGSVVAPNNVVIAPPGTVVGAVGTDVSAGQQALLEYAEQQDQRTKMITYGIIGVGVAATLAYALKK